MIHSDKKAEIQAWVLDAWPAGVLKNADTLQLAVEMLIMQWIKSEGGHKTTLSKAHQILTVINSQIYQKLIGG